MALIKYAGGFGEWGEDGGGRGRRVRKLLTIGLLWKFRLFLIIGTVLV